jgi:two-component system sensor histidine kinase FlrB
MFADADTLLGRPGRQPGLPPIEAGMLADAFSEFIAASARLEGSYRELQSEVAQLGSELAERNAALERSLAENRQMRSFLEQILDSMPCGVLVLSSGERIERMNPEAARLLGVRAHEALFLADLSTRIGIDLCACSAIEGEQQFALPNSSEQQAVAHRRWIEMRTRTLSRADQSPRAARRILILCDITVYKHAEQEREAARRAMALAEIAATLAHEIRNPLAGLELFGGLIAEDAALRESDAASASGAPSRISAWIGHLRAGIRVLSGTVNNVLSFYGVASADLAPLPVSAAFAQAVEFVRPIAAQSEVELFFHGLAGEARVRGSESALGQVILNLVCNAVRHTPKGGRVTVSLSEPRSGWVAMTCSDTGCGIDDEHLPEIFRPGFSVGRTRSGLGLAVCRRIALEHGGSLRVESVPGCGATFVMEIPTI